VCEFNFNGLPLHLRQKKKTYVTFYLHHINFVLSGSIQLVIVIFTL
jgi:hypothetical protein